MANPRKHSIRYEKDHPGCMWGLLQIFDLRHHHSVRRLVSERREGSGRHSGGVGYSKRALNLLAEFDEHHEGIGLSVGENLDDSKLTKIDSWSTSVKTLIADEKLDQHNSRWVNSSTMVEFPRPYIEQEDQLGNQKETNLTCRVACNPDYHSLEYSASLEYGRPSRPKSRETFECIVNQTAPVDGLVSQDLQEKLGEAVEAFLNQKCINAMCLNSDGTHYQSKEMMDALEIINSNKELFLKLLQDPNSLLVKHIQRLQDAQTEKLCRSPCRSLAAAESSEEDTGKLKQSEELIIHEQFHRKNSHRFFRKRGKSRETKPPRKSSKSQNSTNIVVLEPNLARIENTESMTGLAFQQSQYNFGYKGESERVSSNFSLKEIKRKLKRAIGESRKERERISKDGVLDRIPYGHLNISISSGRKDNRSKLKTSQTCINHETALPIGTNNLGTNNLEKLNVTPILIRPRESFICKEAKKHIAEELEHEGVDLQTRQVSRSLERVLSLPEYKLTSPGSSPARELGPIFFSDQIRLSSLFGGETRRHSQVEKTFHRSNQIGQNMENFIFIGSPDGEKQKAFLLDTKLEQSFCLRGDLTPEETAMANNLQIENIVDSKPSVVPPEPENERLIIANYVEESSSEATVSGYSGLDLLEEKSSLDSPSGFFSSSAVPIHEIESSDGAIEKLERPSPISVLEPVFLEDIISPASSMSLQVEFPITSRRIHFDESASSQRTSRFLTTFEPEIDPSFGTEDDEAEFDYVSTVLEASGLTGYEFLGRWHSSDEPLGPSLFDVVEGFPDQFSNNRKLLFDCTNEVLMDVSSRFFGYSPWVSLVKPKTRPLPLGKNLVQEVWAGISWHLNLQSHSPRTFDQIIERDMEKRGSWMDLQSEAECLGVEMEDAILKDLVEEIILELGI